MRKFTLYIGIIMIILLFAALIMQKTYVSQTIPMTEGKLDLSETLPQDMGMIKLFGEWEFYPGRMIDLEEIRSGSVSPEFILVPSQWHSHPLQDRKGYATYHLCIKVPGPGEYSLILKSVYSSFNLLINGSPVLSVGETGGSPAENIPRFKPGTVDFTTSNGEIDIILQVANFHHRKGGLVQEIMFGTPEEVTRVYRYEVIIASILTGVLFIMGLYLLSFYGKNNQDLSVLFFGLFCLVFALRSMLTNTMIILEIIPGLPYELQMKMEYLTISLGYIFFILYSKHAFSRSIDRRFSDLLLIPGFLYTGMIIFFPVYIYNSVLLAFNGLIALYSVYWIISLSIGYRMRHIPATYIIGGSVLALTAVNEMLFYSNAPFSSLFMYNLLPFGLFFFILTHSFEFSYQYIEALKVSRDLTDDLERKIIERTQELHSVNAKLQRLASVDELTGIWNRNELQRKSEEETARYNRYRGSSSEEYALLYMDLDNFKYYNDTYSHKTGDAVLMHFAQLLSTYSRSSDAVFRVGGDEFIMLLPNTGIEGAILTAERILTGMSEVNEYIQRYIQQASYTLIEIPEARYISCSIGIAVHSSGTLVIDNLMRQADNALLKAKSEGKNRFKIHETQPSYI